MRAGPRAPNEGGRHEKFLYNVLWRTVYPVIIPTSCWTRSSTRSNRRIPTRASAEGTRIVPGCGFDSVPSDLGTYLLVRHMQLEGINCREVRAYYQMYGGFGGGTLASKFHQHESGQAVRSKDPFLLSPGVESTALDCGPWNRDPESVFYDAHAEAWVGRFIMGPINTRVVRRSAALFDQLGQPCGHGFRYQEYQTYKPPFARLTGVLVEATLSLFDLAVATVWSRRLLRRVLPKPGEGPSETTKEKGWFSYELLGMGDKGENVWGRIHHQGPPSLQRFPDRRERGQGGDRPGTEPVDRPPDESDSPVSMANDHACRDYPRRPRSPLAV